MRARTLRQDDLRFALVHDWLTVPAGSEAVFEQMCSLFPGAVYASQIDSSRVKFLQGMELHPSWIQKMPGALTRHHLYAPFLPEVYSHMDMNAYDVVLSDSHSFAHGVQRRPDALHINYYHTPARSLWVPEVDNRASKTFFHRWIANRLKRLDLVASKRPDVIFANSHVTAERVTKFYGRKVDQIIYPPVQTEAWSKVEKKGSEEGLVYWGRLIPYKRVDILIEAMKTTGQKLNIVGSGPSEEELKRQAEGSKNIRFLGRLTDDELQKLIASSKALVFPGYEDFGIVPVEAMAAGLPVIAFGAGGVTESVREQDGVLFKEQTAESFIEGLKQFDQKSFDVGALKNRAAEFDVSRFRTFYQEAVNKAIENHLKK
ncbi:MAG TPA: glycosyltransferase [Fimbriimonadaceae bacterium]|jgi:glycosyltransferase involved in cell wall biosynthesis